MGVEYLGGYVPTEPTTVATTTTTSEVTTLNYTEPSTIPLSVVTNDTTVRPQNLDLLLVAATTASAATYI